MSKILKRPMFRGGGKVNSVGTGITSGLVDREPYQYGGRTGQPPVVSTDNKTILDIIQSGSGQVSGVRGRGYTPEEIYQSKVQSYLTTPYEQARMEELIGMSQGNKQNFGLTQTTPETTQTTQTTPEITPKPKLKSKSDEIDISDFEESVKAKAALYEKMLGEGEKKRSVFQALTAAAPELLKEDYGAAIKAAGEQLAGVEDTRKQAKLLAIQEQIKADQLKATAEAKSTGSQALQQYQELSVLYPDMDDEEKRAIAFGTQYQKKESPEDIRFSERKIIQAGTDTFKRNNSAGYEQAAVESVQYGIDTVPYIKADPTNTQSERIIDDSVFKYPGQTLFDPVLKQFYVVSSDGVVEPFKNRKDALDFAKQQVE